MKRTVFFISDGTGITAAALGHSLLTQFEDLEFEEITVPYINTLDKAKELVKRIEDIYLQTGERTLIFTTLVNPELLTIIKSSSAIVFDFFQAFIGPLEEELQTKSSHTIGKTHGMLNYNSYMIRINAVNFALTNDDGSGHEYDSADLILLGVSRCGKTPTSIYLALHFGLYIANYPFTEEDFPLQSLPKSLKNYRNQLFGLTIDPARLMRIRQERRPDSEYASAKQCQYEIQEAENFYKREGIPFINTTTRSIEEIAAEIVALTGKKRRIFL